MLHLSTKLVLDSSVRNARNLCSHFTDQDLQKIGGYCFTGYQHDKQSRSAWEQRTEAAMNLAMQIAQAKNFPWPGCSNVVFPLISIGALQFSARSYSNIIQGTDVVKYRVIGADDSGQLKQRAERISRHMSWQVLEEDSDWEEQHDKQMVNLSVVGLNFIKTFHAQTDGSALAHNDSDLVLAQNLVFDYWATSIETCARKTHIYPLYKNEIWSQCKSGLFRDITEERWYAASRSTPIQANPQDRRHGLNPPPADDDAPFTFHEQHRWLDLDGDGYAEPYIITYEERSHAVVRVVARWERDEDIMRNSAGEIVSIHSMEYFTKYGFVPSPDGSMMDIGFGVLIGPLNEAVNSGINQLIDAGTMNNSTGGFLGRGAKIKGGVYTLKPWDWARVDSTGDDLRKNIFQFPTKEPSMVLFKLLEMLINYTERLAGATDIMQGETPGQNTPAETSRNALEQGMQIYSAIFKRYWRSMKEEFKKLHQLNAIFMPAKKEFGEPGQFVLREDYKTNPDFVVPVADPRLTSDAQRLQRAQMLKQAAMVTPGYDKDAVEREFLKALRIEGINTIFPGSKKLPPGTDPKMAIEQLRGQLKAQEMKLEWQKFQLELSETHRVNTAQIAQLEAQALALMAKADDEKAKQHLRILEIAIDSLRAHSSIITDRMNIAQGAIDAENQRQHEAQLQSDQQDHDSQMQTQQLAAQPSPGDSSGEQQSAS